MEEEVVEQKIWDPLVERCRKVRYRVTVESDGVMTTTQIPEPETFCEWNCPEKANCKAKAEKAKRTRSLPKAA